MRETCRVPRGGIVQVKMPGRHFNENTEVEVIKTGVKEPLRRQIEELGR